MDLLENIVFPQSATNILLLKYLFFLTLLILLPYLGVLLTSTLFSVMHFYKGRSSGNREYLIFANELIDLFTPSKGAAFALGFVPLISLTFLLSQLLLNSGLNISGNLIFVLALFVIATIYVYAYKYSFRLKNIFNLINVSELKDDQVISEFEQFSASNSRLLARSGAIGFILLLIVSYLLISLLQVTLDSTQWNESTNLLTILISPAGITYFFFFLSFSFVLTCSTIIFKYFKKDATQNSKSYINYVKSFSLKTGLIFTFIQPLLFVLSILSNSSTSLSFWFFIYTVLSLLLMLWVSITFYFMYKESKTHLGGSALLISILLISVLIYKDQLAFETTSTTQINNLSLEYDRFAEQLKIEAGIESIVEVNGEDIYNAKCIACHRFDVVLVGPAYNDVLPKYDGKRNELVDYILNPRKIDPKYPSMPNQGLKPREADAIADYIVKIYNGN